MSLTKQSSAGEIARTIGTEVASKHADSVDRQSRFPAEAVAAIKKERLMSLLIPKDLGGQGAPFFEAAEVCCALAQSCASTGMIYAMHQIKTSSLISHGQNSPWHRKFMQRISDEQLLLASATTEAGIGGDLRNSICAVETKGDQFTLEKMATVISYGKYADAILVTARKNAEAPHSDQVMVAVTKDQYTLDQIGDWDTLGM
ncbi:MAG: acyl-CoA dehydrogenase family protein, partial [Steroidobacter sp.]